MPWDTIMQSPTITWADHMRQALADLQQRPLLHRLLAFAEQGGEKLFAVGGTLRDICLGHRAQDLDLALAGDVMGFARRFASHLRAAFVPMDPERGEARVVYRKRDVIDFAQFKGDTIGADLRRRDFTINAMACPLARLLTHAAPELIDPYGGWQDLQARVIRMVSPLSFHEDPLRLLRAFRLAASVDFAIEPATLAAMAPVVPRLADVAAERIHSELLKLFGARHSHPHVVTMADLGLLDVLFPELAATRGIAIGFDARQDVFGHAVQTYRSVEDLLNAPGSHLAPIADVIAEYLRVEEHRELISWAALLHPIGTSALRREAVPAEEEHLSYAEQSAQQWDQIGSRLKLSRQRIEYIRRLIADQGRPFEFAALEAKGRLTLRSVYGWCKETRDDMLGVFLLAIGHALAKGQTDTPVHGAIALARSATRLWNFYRGRILPVLSAPRLLTGNDLQQIFKLTPGPPFKTLLDGLEVAQAEGRIHTRAEALQWVEDQLTMS
jgi:poly(A) polymerase